MRSRKRTASACTRPTDGPKSSSLGQGVPRGPVLERDPQEALNVKRYRIEFSPEAVRRVEAIAAWWAANRASRAAPLRRRVRAGLRQLQARPIPVKPFDHQEFGRRGGLLLPKCGHHIYYTADD